MESTFENELTGDGVGARAVLRSTFSQVRAPVLSLHKVSIEHTFEYVDRQGVQRQEGCARNIARAFGTLHHRSAVIMPASAAVARSSLRRPRATRSSRCGSTIAATTSAAITSSAAPHSAPIIACSSRVLSAVFGVRGSFGHKLKKKPF